MLAFTNTEARRFSLPSVAQDLGVHLWTSYMLSASFCATPTPVKLARRMAAIAKRECIHHWTQKRFVLGACGTVEAGDFDRDLMRQCEEMNREFIRAQKQRS